MLKYLFVSNFLFLGGLLGLFFTSKHIMLMLLSMELIFLSMNFNFLVFSVFLDDLLGQYYALSVITVAAAESAMGLAIIVMFFRLSGGISLDIMSLLKK